MDDKEAEYQLKRLSQHYGGQPVLPVQKYCASIWTWMTQVRKAYDEDVAKGEAHPRFADIAPVMHKVRLAIEKSNLLWRLIYEGQPLRTKRCPEHDGHWTGCPTPETDCEHGCDLTGWIPDDFVPPDPDGPCQHKWRLFRHDKVIVCKTCGEEIGTWPLQKEVLEPPPIDMVLHCPKCGKQHIDVAEEGEWDNPPHKSHLCHSCGTIWRPADVPTNGVKSIDSRGKKDTWPTSS